MAAPTADLRAAVAVARPGAGRRGARAGGVTLAELAVSLVVVSILSVTVGSVLVLSSHAVGLSAAHAGEVRFDDVVATIAAEQRFALSVTERTPTSIAFTVADRDNDGLPESIRYSWSGKPGDPLTRQLNKAQAVVLVPKVDRFNLTYITRAGAAPPAVPDVESDEVLLFGHEGGTTAVSVSTTAWAAQFIKPNWAALAPGKTVKSWKVTGIQVVASKWPSSTNITQWNLSLYDADQSTYKPAGVLPVEGRKFLPSLTSQTPAWISAPVPFSTNANLDPAKGMCVVVGPATLAPSGYVGVDASAGEPGGYFMLSGTSGTSYGTPNANRSMRLRVRGKYTYAG